MKKENPDECASFLCVCVNVNYSYLQRKHRTKKKGDKYKINNTSITYTITNTERRCPAPLHLSPTDTLRIAIITVTTHLVASHSVQKKMGSLGFFACCCSPDAWSREREKGTSWGGGLCAHARTPTHKGKKRSVTGGNTLTISTSERKSTQNSYATPHSAPESNNWCGMDCFSSLLLGARSQWVMLRQHRSW